MSVYKTAVGPCLTSCVQNHSWTLLWCAGISPQGWCGSTTSVHTHRSLLSDFNDACFCQLPGHVTGRLHEFPPIRGANLHQGIGNNQQRSARFTCRPDSTHLLPQASPSKGTTLSATLSPSPIAASRWCTVYVMCSLCLWHHLLLL